MLNVRYRWPFKTWADYLVSGCSFPESEWYSYYQIHPRSHFSVHQSFYRFNFPSAVWDCCAFALLIRDVARVVYLLYSCLPMHAKRSEMSDAFTDHGLA